MGDIEAEFARLRQVCTLSDGQEVKMPPTNTPFEGHMMQMEKHWVELGKLLPGVDDGSQEQGRKLEHRSAAALKLIRNHEAVIRDVCNPLQTNVVGKELTQTHIKRLPVQHAQYVEEALRMVTLKLLGVQGANGIAPRLDAS